MAEPGQVLATLAELAPHCPPVVEVKVPADDMVALPVGVTFGVHPEGPDAHIERRLALHRAGWDVAEAFDTKWGERRTELAVELILEARRRVPS